MHALSSKDVSSNNKGQSNKDEWKDEEQYCIWGNQIEVETD